MSRLGTRKKKAAPRRQARSLARQERILEVALGCFTERGVEATPIGRIARRSGASVGSIYHQFGSKDGIAAAIYVEALRRYQEGLLARVEGVTDAREGVVAIVSFHLRWSHANPEWARVLSAWRRAELVALRESDIRRMNQELGRTLAAWVGPRMASGELEPMHVDLFLALLLGPCQEYVRSTLEGRAISSLDDAERVLAEGAWRAVGSDPIRG